MKPINKSLDYIPSFDNAIVYRNEMTTHPERLRKWFASHIEEIVEFPNFLSTYHNREYWQHAEPDFKIQTNSGSKGKYISAHVGKSMRLKESEVLFQSNTRFRILSVDDMINLQEVEEEPSHIIWEGSFYSHDTIEDQRTLSLSDLGEI
ncbi:MAG: hypothetical protein EOO61_13050 [Hymenobacter sp.]|nr:MAG: hypothetical protein EOO61_13050 [Hymenobacter sp.]